MEERRVLRSAPVALRLGLARPVLVNAAAVHRARRVPVPVPVPVPVRMCVPVDAVDGGDVSFDVRERRAAGAVDGHGVRRARGAVRLLLLLGVNLL